MLDGPDLDLAVVSGRRSVRRLGDGPASVCDEGGGRSTAAPIRNRLACLLDLEHDAAAEDGSWPGRGIFARTRRGACPPPPPCRHPELRTVPRRPSRRDSSRCCGHWHLGTTMRYVPPSATFIRGRGPPAVSGPWPGWKEMVNSDNGSCRLARSDTREVWTGRNAAGSGRAVRTALFRPRQCLALLTSSRRQVI